MSIYKDYLRGILKPVRDFQLKHGARIYVGEFSAVAWAPGAEKYLEDCIALFEEYGWDWTYHAFREWQGWSVEHEGDSATTLRRRLKAEICLWIETSLSIIMPSNVIRHIIAQNGFGIKMRFVQL